MINDIIDAISIKLNQVFGDGVKIYSENVEQGLQEPCFFIKPLNPSQTQIIWSRYYREYPIDIHYFPQVQGNFAEMMVIADSLMSQMDLITMINGDMIRGTDIHYEVVDGVLHFFVKYMMIVSISVTPDEGMDTLTINTNTVEG